MTSGAFFGGRFDRVERGQMAGQTFEVVSPDMNFVTHRFADLRPVRLFA